MENNDNKDALPGFKIIDPSVFKDNAMKIINKNKSNNFKTITIDPLGELFNKEESNLKEEV